MPTPLRSLASPIALAALGTGAAAALALHSIPLGAVGALTYAALVAWDLLAPAPAPPPRSGPRLPDPASVRDPGVRDAVAQILAARLERERVLAETPASVSGALAEALASVDDLEQNAATLVERAEDLGRYIATRDGDATRAELERLSRRAAETRDAAARAEYERARAAREDDLKTLDDITSARDRIEANLARIAATVASLPAKLVRMRALDAEALDTVGADVSRDLHAVERDVKLFEETLRSLGERTNP